MQTCVVSLDPVSVHLDVPVEVEFWPRALVDDLARQDAEESGTQGLLDWPEAVVDGRIDLGPVIYESLATALDPYPKREGVSFDWSQGAAKEAGRSRDRPICGLGRPQTALGRARRAKSGCHWPRFKSIRVFRGLPRGRPAA